MQTINLPSGAKSKVIEITDIGQINPTYLKDKVSLSDKYTCLFYNNEVKHFAMILSKEVNNRNVLDEVKENLNIDITILKQLYAIKKREKQ